MVELVWFISGAAMAFAILVAFGLRKFKTATKPNTPPNPCEYSHEFITIEAQPLRGEMLAFAQTVVLKRCSRCNLHIAVAYAGTWSLEDFMKKESEIAELERMAK